MSLEKKSIIKVRSDPSHCHVISAKLSDRFGGTEMETNEMKLYGSCWQLGNGGEWRALLDSVV